MISNLFYALIFVILCKKFRVGRWNSNIIAQSNMITQGHLIVHSPNDANAASGSSRQPTTGERGELLFTIADQVSNVCYFSSGYIFGNIHVNHRIQCWSFGESSFPPDISDSSKNIVVPKCKINNDSSVSISSCNQYLAAIIPAYRAQDVKISKPESLMFQFLLTTIIFQVFSV